MQCVKRALLTRDESIVTQVTLIRDERASRAFITTANNFIIFIASPFALKVSKNKKYFNIILNLNIMFGLILKLDHFELFGPFFGKSYLVVKLDKVN